MKKFNYYHRNETYIIRLSEDTPNTIEIDHFSDRDTYIDGINIPCIDNYNYVVKVNKCSLSGKSGAAGIYNFLETANKERFMDSWISIICKSFLPATWEE